MSLVQRLTTLGPIAKETVKIDNKFGKAGAGRFVGVEAQRVQWQCQLRFMLPMSLDSLLKVSNMFPESPMPEVSERGPRIKTRV